MEFRDPVARQIADFLDGIGIEVLAEALPGDTFLPAMRVRGGALVVDPDRLRWPGDMLHEAGHIAMTDPDLRSSLDQVSDDPGEEMAAIAWSYAASVAIELDPKILFHEGGYRGASANLIENFTNGRDVGVPWLAAYDMTVDWRGRGEDGSRRYPHMLRWLR
jgi:hypothetical protein